MVGFNSSFNAKSPVSRQDFLWLAEYSDGSHLSEIDLQTRAENSFYAVDKENLIRFGLFGHGMKMFFERDGIFNIVGRVFDIFYRRKRDGKEFYLTGHSGRKYGDIITYKDATTTLSVNKFNGNTRINQYNFGYKADIVFPEISFRFQPIVKVPFNSPVLLNIKLVSDDSIDGELVVKRNGTDVFVVNAPLRKGRAGELNWVVS